MKSMQKGFTLIELMIVVAIIAILAAIAIPAYQDYLIRSQVSEGASLSDAAETAVAEFYSNTGRLPGNNTSAGLPGATSIKGKYVSQVDATGGVVKATFSDAGGFVANSAITTDVLAFSPITGASAGSITWHCGQGTTTVPQKYLPASCRGTGQ